MGFLEVEKSEMPDNIGNYTSKRSYVPGLIRDIKKNGMAYIKSHQVVNEVKARNSKINIEYDSEDRIYIATYEKGGK